MRHDGLKMTYVGGPTVLLEMGGLRLLTDPTFDPAGSEYKTAVYTLRKTMGPAVGVDAIGRVDVVLLSHDHHFDNLDRSGREMLARAGRVLTTRMGAERLGGSVVGLGHWESVELKTPDGRVLKVTATPARHGPADGDRGPVIGFVLELEGAERAVYVSGDTVWYEGVAEVAKRFRVGTALLFMGAARVKEVGPNHLTFTAEEGVKAARCLGDAVIVPVHCEGWEHFSEGREVIEGAFGEAGMEGRLKWLGE